MTFQIGPYDPCPCGSGNKYKFCCAAKAKANRHGKFPIGTVAFYGPDDKTITKIVAGVILSEYAEPILDRFVGTSIVGDPKIAEQIKRFFASHGVKEVAVTDGNLGCPHEEGEDYPEGQDCPFCPFWARKQGSSAQDRLLPSGNAILPRSDAVPVDDGEDDDESPDRDFDASFARIEAILGDDELGFDQAIEKIFDYLKAHLQLPVEVTGIEDFQWEEPYVFGGWSTGEYKRLKKSQPSFEDRYQLLDVKLGHISEWMMFRGKDIGAIVQRISDGKRFILGLCELQVIDKSSSNYQLLDDYAVWFANSR